MQSRPTMTVRQPGRLTAGRPGCRRARTRPVVAAAVVEDRTGRRCPGDLCGAGVDRSDGPAAPPGRAQRAHRAEFVTAAKESGGLLSIDFQPRQGRRAEGDRPFHQDVPDDFTKGAQDFVKTAEGSKAVTVGKINAAALESENGDTGVVLLAATSQVTNANGARQDPRAWRMKRDDDPRRRQVEDVECGSCRER